MNPPDFPSPSEEQIRRQREEAARRQQLQLRQQTQRIQEQRMRPVNPQKGAPASGAPVARPMPASVTPSPSAPRDPPKAPAPTAPASGALPPKVARPLSIRVSGWVNAEKAAAELAALTDLTRVSPARQASTSPSIESKPNIVPNPEAAVVPPKVAPVVLKMKVAPLDLPPPAEPGLDDVEVVTESAEPVFPSRGVKVALPPPELEQTLEIEPTSLGIELPELRLATEPAQPPTTRSAKAYKDSISSLPVEDPARLPPAEASQIDPLDRDLVPLPDLFCAKCKTLIPESYHGAFFTACPKCGEIMKMK